MRGSKNAPPSLPPGSAEYAAEMHARIAKEIIRSEALASAIAAVVRQFVPDKNTVDAFQSALCEWLTGDSRDQLVRLKEQSEIPDENYATPERLIQLIEMRNRLQETIHLMEERITEVESHATGPFEAMGAMVPAMQLQVDPYRRQLEDLEQQISEVQAELEAEPTSAANSGAPQSENAVGDC